MRQGPNKYVGGGCGEMIRTKILILKLQYYFIIKISSNNYYPKYLPDIDTFML